MAMGGTTPGSEVVGLGRVERLITIVFVGPHAMLSSATPAQSAQNLLKYNLEFLESMTIPGGLDKQPLYS